MYSLRPVTLWATAPEKKFRHAKDTDHTVESTPGFVAPDQKPKHDPSAKTIEAYPLEKLHAM